MRRVTGLAAVAATGLVTAACMHAGSATAGIGTSTTSASDNAEPNQAVAAAYQATIDAGSAKTTMTTEVGIGNENVPITASGVLDFGNRAADLTEQLPGGQATAETRFVNGMLYEHVPSAAVQQLSGGKPWISLDLNRLSSQGGGSLQQLMTDTPSDPTTVLGYLRGAGARVTTVGPDTVDGTATTHYRVTIDLDKAATGQNSETQQAIHVVEQEIGSHTLPAEAWIDDQGRLRKVTMRETLRGNETTTPAKPVGTVSFGFTATLSDFGVPVSVTAPPPDQTADLTDKLTGH